MERLREGDKEARKVLIEKNLGLVHHIVKRFLGRGVEAEDLFQIGYITLYQTISGYDGNKNDNLFYTYFSKALEHAFLGLIRINNTNKKKTFIQIDGCFFRMGH